MPATTAAYAIRFDDTEETYKYEVIDADGDILDSFETKAEARRDVHERLAADRAERDEEEAAELRERIAERLEDLDLAHLEAVAAFLNL